MHYEKKDTVVIFFEKGLGDITNPMDCYNMWFNAHPSLSAISEFKTKKNIIPWRTNDHVWIISDRELKNTTVANASKIVSIIKKIAEFIRDESSRRRCTVQHMAGLLACCASNANQFPTVVTDLTEFVKWRGSHSNVQI